MLNFIAASSLFPSEWILSECTPDDVVQNFQRKRPLQVSMIGCSSSEDCGGVSWLPARLPEWTCNRDGSKLAGKSGCRACQKDIGHHTR